MGFESKLKENDKIKKWVAHISHTTPRLLFLARFFVFSQNFFSWLTVENEAYLQILLTKRDTLHPKLRLSSTPFSRNPILNNCLNHSDYFFLNYWKTPPGSTRIQSIIECNECTFFHLWVQVFWQSASYAFLLFSDRKDFETWPKSRRMLTIQI